MLKMFRSSPWCFCVLWQLGEDWRRPTMEVLVMELTAVRQGGGNIKKGYSVATANQQTLRKEGVVQDLMKCHWV